MIIEEFDTSNNKRTLADSEPLREDEGEHAPGTTERMPMGGDPEPPQNLENLVKSAYQQGISYQQKVLQPKWRASYAAFNNQHFAGSKYLTPRYRGRTHLFRPKTRSAVRRKSSEAVAALFQTADVVEVSPGNDADPTQIASAAVNKELLNYRLTTAAENAGIPWFLIASGAHQTAQITGIVVSKQSWEYREKIVGEEEVTYQNPDGTQSIEIEPKTRIVKDRPRIDLYPPEDVIRDPSANWLNQAQDSSYLILKNPMSLSDAREFLKQVDKDGRPMFLPVDEVTLAAQANVKDDQSGTSDATRRARETTSYDRYHDDSVEKEFQTVWMHENFFRIDGEDWHFWTLGVSKVVSDVRPVDKIYPEQGGARPVTIGVGSLDAFKIDPMSPVEAWSPLQTEVNDVVNLRLEVMKQTVSPVTKVRMGRQIDLKQVQNRSPDSVIYVQDMEDVEFDRPGEVGQGAFVEMERLNVDFDELAGTFSPGSVQSNNQLNKTATGLSLISGSSNAMGEFDLRVWVETWAEDALRQTMKAIQFYESDERVRAIAGQKAKLRQKFGMDEVTDELLTQQVTLRINIGVGASDPMVRLQKLQGAIMATIQAMPTAQQRLKQDPLIDEIWGAAGYKDAAERFFHPGDDMDPRIQEMGQQLQMAEAALEDKSADRAHQLQLEQTKQVGGVVGKHLDHRQTLEQKRADFAMQQVSVQQDQEFQSEQGDVEHGRAVDMKRKDAEIGHFMAEKQGQRQEASEKRQLAVKASEKKPPAKSNGNAPANGDFDGFMQNAMDGGQGQMMTMLMKGLQQIGEMGARNDQAIMKGLQSLAKTFDVRMNAMADAIEEAVGGQPATKAEKPKKKFKIIRGQNGFATEVQEVN
jgi:hypothetical protein